MNDAQRRTIAKRATDLHHSAMMYEKKVFDAVRRYQQIGTIIGLQAELDLARAEYLEAITNMMTTLIDIAAEKT